MAEMGCDVDGDWHGPPALARGLLRQGAGVLRLLISWRSLVAADRMERGDE